MFDLFSTSNLHQYHGTHEFFMDPTLKEKQKLMNEERRQWIQNCGTQK